MKIYRVVPSNFFMGYRLDEDIKESPETLYSETFYYKMGYTHFYKETGHDFNTIDCENLQGKYFCLFPEDAILEGFKLMNITTN